MSPVLHGISQEGSTTRGSAARKPSPRHPAPPPLRSSPPQRCAPSEPGTARFPGMGSAERGPRASTGPWAPPRPRSPRPAYWLLSPCVVTRSSTALRKIAPCSLHTHKPGHVHFMATKSSALQGPSPQQTCSSLACTSFGGWGQRQGCGHKTPPPTPVREGPAGWG